MPRLQGNVKFDNVSFSYNGKDEVLKNIFEAKQGETVALVGHTGSGKFHYECTLSVLRI